MRSKELVKEYNGRLVLNIPSLEFNNGKIYAVMGANGSGKSTLAGMLESGDAFLFDKPEKIVYIPQKPFAFRMNVKKNALLAGGEEKKVSELLKVLGLEELKYNNAKKLSGGELAKLSLTRVLSVHCDLLILDEPTAAMDVESTLTSENLIKEYAEKENAAVILITHSKGQAERISDELIVLNRGNICDHGPTATILNNPTDPETKRFLAL